MYIINNPQISCLTYKFPLSNISLPGSHRPLPSYQCSITSSGNSLPKPDLKSAVDKLDCHPTWAHCSQYYLPILFHQDPMYLSDIAYTMYLITSDNSGPHNIPQPLRIRPLDTAINHISIAQTRLVTNYWIKFGGNLISMLCLNCKWAITPWGFIHMKTVW